MNGKGAKILSIQITDMEATLEIGIRRPDGNHGYIKFQVVDKTRKGGLLANPELVPVLCLIRTGRELVKAGIDPVETLRAALAGKVV